MSKSSCPNMSGSNSGFGSSEEVKIRILGSMVHLIDTDRSVELACGEFNIVRLKQDNTVVATPAGAGVASDDGEREIRIDSLENMLNYGLTRCRQGAGEEAKNLDRVLEKYSAFRAKKSPAVSWVEAAKEISPTEMERRE
ncbi:hypothetical protein DM860_009684 [Cuscuta australis]|uniref:Uncharacterized protein n=1 Tax=Cuscuta australis TaxID=267555 RepID=A0A328DKP3_9ASTE|nr:hypothetical protein DM860_009684 [Cuscuta australis]